MGHYPAFSVNHLDCMGTYPDARNEFWDSLAQAGAQVYFCGHDHFLDHAKARTSSGGWIHQYVVGSGGAPLYDWNGIYLDNVSNPGTVEGIAHFRQDGYCVIDVNGFDVRLTLKQRAGANYYVACDTFAYTGPLVGPGVPTASLAGLLAAMMMVILIFGVRRYAAAT